MESGTLCTRVGGVLFTKLRFLVQATQEKREV